MPKVIVQCAKRRTFLNIDAVAVKHKRPCVTIQGALLDELVANGELKLFAKDLPASADDMELFKMLRENDKAKDPQKVSFVIAAYCATLGVSPSGEKIKTEKGKGAKEQEEEENNKNPMPLDDADKAQENLANLADESKGKIAEINGKTGQQ